MPQATI